MTPTMKLPPGRLLRCMVKFHGYSVVRPIGIGGSGEVWLVRHDLLQTDFAVKVIPKSVLDADAELRDQFAVEARISGMVRHSSLVSVYDAGLDEPTGLYFFVMDYMPGGSVAEHLSRERRFSIAKAAKIARDIAVGLAELKRLGIVHRDVKPLNMLFTKDGSARLSDFGIALFKQTVPGAGSGVKKQGDEKKESDVAIGTPLYMSYEQILDSDSVDCRSDIYSLGVSFFEMLAGACPGATMSSDELLQRRMDGERLPDIRTVNTAIPEDVAQLILKMTDPDAESRISSPDEVVSALDAILERFGSPNEEDKGKKGDNARNDSGRSYPWKKTVLALFCFGVVVSLVFVFVMTPSWIKSHDSNRKEKGVEVFRPIVAPQPAAVDKGVVTQVVEMVHEVVKTVVVTTLQESVQAPHVKRRRVFHDAEAKPSAENKEPDEDIFAQNDSGEDESGQLAVALQVVEPTAQPRPAQSDTASYKPRSEVVCGITVSCEAGMGEQLDLLVSDINEADDAVRHFFPIASGASVQNAVRTIRIVDKCGNKTGHVFNNANHELLIDCDTIRNYKRRIDLVSRFMASYRDGVSEPDKIIRSSIYEYVRLGVVASLRRKLSIYHTLSDRRREIERDIRYVEELEGHFGSADYLGRYKRYNAKSQVIPYRYDMNRFGRGKIFALLQALESSNPMVVREYFTLKANAFKSGKIAGYMTIHDWAALLSNAAGVNLFSELEGWGFERFATRIRLGGPNFRDKGFEGVTE